MTMSTWDANIVDTRRIILAFCLNWGLTITIHYRGWFLLVDMVGLHNTVGSIFNWGLNTFTFRGYSMIVIWPDTSIFKKTIFLSLYDQDTFFP